MRNPAVRCRALRCGQPRDSSRSLARLKAMNTRTTQPTDKRLLACFGKGGGVPQLRGGSQAETFVSNGWTATSSPPIRAASSVISIEVPGVTAQPAIVGPETFLSSAVARRRPTSCLNRGWMGPTVRTEPGARSEAAAQRQICAGQRQGSPDAGKTTRASSKGCDALKNGVALEFSTRDMSGRTAESHASGWSGTQSGSTLPVAGFGLEQFVLRPPDAH